MRAASLIVGRTHRRAAWLALTLAVVVAPVSCGDLTSVAAPDVIQPAKYGTIAGATALAAGAITQFHIAFGGSEQHVIASGLMSDELFATSSLINSATGGLAPWDSRDPTDPNLATPAYTQLHNARQRLLSAITAFKQVAPDSTARIGQLFAMLGYTSVFFAETFCAGVPLSHRDADLRPVYGTPLTTAQLLDSAIAAFDSAMLYGIDSARIANFARVGRGRVFLNLGRFADAEAAVASVPTTFVYNVTYLNMEGLNNGFFRTAGTPPWATGFTVPDREGSNGLDWVTSNDPRVTLINRPAVGGTQPAVTAFAPYQSSTAPIRLATGIEARLIEAEAALQAGDAAAWLAHLNALRALGTSGGGVAGLSPLTDPGTPTARVDLQFRERAFWLYLTGHRLGDLRRLVRQYGRAAESVFPTGVWRDGLQYGNATNMAPPAGELNNPNYKGCLNRDA